MTTLHPQIKVSSASSDVKNKTKTALCSRCYHVAVTYIMFVYVAVPGIALHLSSSAQESRGSSYPPGHLGELFLAAGMREGISASHAPQGYQQYTPPLPRAHPPHFHSPPPTPPFIQQPFQHLLSGSIIFCKMDVQHYAGVKAIFLLKWIFTHLLT